MTELELHTAKTALYFEDEINQDEGPELARHMQATLEEVDAFMGNQLGLFDEGLKAIELSVALCSEKRIRELNSEYRAKDKVTDVLSFPVHESLRPENRHGIFSEGALNLGDIIICRQVAERQAGEFEITFEQEVVHLIVHGLLHLVGYDHEISEDEERIMFELEEDLVKKIYKRLGY